MTRMRSLATATILLGMCWRVICQDVITLNKFQRCHQEGSGMSMVLMTCPVQVNTSATIQQLRLQWSHNGSAISEDTHQRAYVFGSYQQELRISSAHAADSGDYDARVAGTNVIVCAIRLSVLSSPRGCQVTSMTSTPPLVILAEWARGKRYTAIAGDKLCIPLAPSLVQGQYLTAARPYNVTISVFREDRLLQNKASLSNSSKSVCVRRSTVGGAVPTYSSYVTVATTTGCPTSAMCLFLWSAEFTVVTQPRSYIQAVTANMSVLIGQHITYMCSSYGFQPLLRIYKSFDGTVLVDTATEQARHYNTASSDGWIFYQIDRNSTTTTVKVQAPSAALIGSIVCAVRSLGSSDVNDQRLTVIQSINKPVVVIRKYLESNCNRTAYRCDSYGLPKPTTTWEYNGVALHNRSVLSLGKATPHGQYTCVGSNSKGVGLDSVDFNGTACEEPSSSPAISKDVLVLIVAPITCVVVLALFIPFTCHLWSSRKQRLRSQRESQTQRTSVDVSAQQEEAYPSDDSLSVEAGPGSKTFRTLAIVAGVPNVRPTSIPNVWTNVSPQPREPSPTSSGGEMIRTSKNW